MGITERLNLTRRKVLVAVSLVALFVLGLFIWQAVSASLALRDAHDEATQLQQQIEVGDFTGAERTLTDLRNSTHKAHDETGGLLWDAAGYIPYFGRNVSAVQTVADVLDTATAINAPIALHLNQALNAGTFKPVHGKFDLAAIARLTPEVHRAAASITSAGRALDKIDASGLNFPFNDIVGNLQVQFDRARSAAASTSTAFDLLPPMLGESSKRTYLLMIQNPAELRSTGGLPGSLAILTADKGQLTMGWQGSSGDINPRGNPPGFPAPVVQLRKDTLNLYGSTPATDFRDLNFGPDFPQAAQIARVMVKRRGLGSVDGVVSVDPIALSYLLQGSQPITVSGAGFQTQLRATDLVPTLLNRLYQVNQSPTGQDDFFKTVARTIFNSVTGGLVSQQKAVTGLATATNEHRVLLWSNDPSEEARLTGTAISGDVGGDAGSTPLVGMYINDSTAAKMDYYLHYRTAASAVDCRERGAQDLRATISLSSAVPASFSSLGPYILGDGTFAKPGTIALNLRIYAPYGGQITAITVDGVTRSVTDDKDAGRQVAFLPLELTPGQQRVVTADIQTRDGQSGDGIFNFTPGIVSAPNGTKIASAC